MTDKKLDPDLSARLEKAIDEHLGKQPEPCDNVWCGYHMKNNSALTKESIPQSLCLSGFHTESVRDCVAHKRYQSRPDIIGEIREYVYNAYAESRTFHKTSFVIEMGNLLKHLDKLEQGES